MFSEHLVHKKKHPVFSSLVTFLSGFFIGVVCLYVLLQTSPVMFIKVTLDRNPELHDQFQKYYINRAISQNKGNEFLVSK